MRTAATFAFGFSCLGFLSGACSPDGTSGPDCQVAAPSACPDPKPRYADVVPIIEQRCAGPCHAGILDGPWSLADYEHVADWADVVRADLLDCSMPPADSGVSMTADERLAILVWIRCGFPE